MKKEKFDFKAAFERESEIKARLGEIANAMETEKRESTDAEKAEVKELRLCSRASVSSSSLSAMLRPQLTCL